MTRRLISLMLGAVAAFCSVTMALEAQGRGEQRAPRVRVSPHETHEFDVDGSHWKITYGRPSKKGREIWGVLVPYGRWWMPGADESTTVITDKAVKFGALTMPAGEHTLYMAVEEKEPKLIISKETGQFHTVYHPDLDLGRVEFVVRTVSPIVEQMTFAVVARQGGGGALTLTWDDREYSAKFEVVK